MVSEVLRPSGGFAYVWQKQNVASCRDGRAVSIVPSMLTTIMTLHHTTILNAQIFSTNTNRSWLRHLQNEYGRCNITIIQDFEIARLINPSDVARKQENQPPKRTRRAKFRRGATKALRKLERLRNAPVLQD